MANFVLERNIKYASAKLDILDEYHMRKTSKSYFYTFYYCFYVMAGKQLKIATPLKWGGGIVKCGCLYLSEYLGFKDV